MIVLAAALVAALVVIILIIYSLNSGTKSNFEVMENNFDTYTEQPYPLNRLEEEDWRN